MPSRLSETTPQASSSARLPRVPAGIARLSAGWTLAAVGAVAGIWALRWLQRLHERWYYDDCTGGECEQLSEGFRAAEAFYLTTNVLLTMVVVTAIPAAIAGWRHRQRRQAYAAWATPRLVVLHQAATRSPNSNQVEDRLLLAGAGRLKGERWLFWSDYAFTMAIMVLLASLLVLAVAGVGLANEDQLAEQHGGWAIAAGLVGVAGGLGAGVAAAGLRRIGQSRVRQELSRMDMDDRALRMLPPWRASL